MKKLLILPILFFACKKNDVAPQDPVALTTNQQVAAPCQKANPMLGGAYVSLDNVNDTVKILFIKDNCPIENSNVYVMVNFGNISNSVNTKSMTPNPQIESNEFKGRKVAYIASHKYGMQVYTDSIKQIDYLVVSGGQHTFNFQKIK